MFWIEAHPERKRKEVSLIPLFTVRIFIRERKNMVQRMESGVHIFSQEVTRSKCISLEICVSLGTHSVPTTTFYCPKLIKVSQSLFKSRH